MATEIHTTFEAFRAAFDQILALARHELCIFDDDLAQLGLEQAARMAELQRLLTGNPKARARIALKRTDHLTRDHPRLVQLMKYHGHLMEARQIPDTLQRLRDSLVIVDQRCALVRFDWEHPRSRLILEDDVETAPYLKRFEAIWAEGGHVFSPTPLGL
jgi:hypothetical protein